MLLRVRTLGGGVSWLGLRGRGEKGERVPVNPSGTHNSFPSNLLPRNVTSCVSPSSFPVSSTSPVVCVCTWAWGGEGAASGVFIGLGHQYLSASALAADFSLTGRRCMVAWAGGECAGEGVMGRWEEGIVAVRGVAGSVETRCVRLTRYA